MPFRTQGSIEVTKWTYYYDTYHHIHNYWFPEPQTLKILAVTFKLIMHFEKKKSINSKPMKNLEKASIAILILGK